MLGSLLLLVCTLCVDCETQRSSLFTASLARLPIARGHCADVPNDDAADDESWETLEWSRISDDGIPPSPAILNVRGWRAASTILVEHFRARIHSYFVDPFGASIASFDATNDPTDILPVTSEVAEILNRWETGSRSIKPMSIRFSRTIFDLTREVEIRAEGKMRYESASSGRIQIEPSVINRANGNAMVSQRKGRDGKPFRLEADVPTEWIFANDEIISINEADRTYSIVPLPVDTKSQQSDWFLRSLQFHAPLIFKIEMDKLRRQWSFNLMKEDSQSVILEAMPRTTELRACYQRCLVRIDSKSSRVTAVKYVSSSGNIEVVYTIIDWTTDPFNMGMTVRRDLTGYRLR